MADKNSPKDNPSIFQKIIDASSAMLDAQIYKAKNSMEKAQPPIEADFNFGKAVTKDQTYSLGSQGFHEKPGVITFEHQRQMALKSSVIAAIIKTRQSMAASYAKPSKGGSHGFKIVLKDEKSMLAKIQKELFPEQEQEEDNKKPGQNPEHGDGINGSTDGEVQETVTKAAPMDDEALQGLDEAVDLPPEQLSEKDQEREAKKELEERTAKKKKYITAFLLNCGEDKDRPFQSKKWNFDSYLRAIIWDSLIYDQVATELVPKEAQNLNGKFNVHHFQPIDGATIRFASPALVKYRSGEMSNGYDILYPEEELKALEERDALELDEERLERNEYKYVQVIRGRILRAFTENEIAIGMRNPVTDLISNGYAISELEILVSLVTSHLNTEFYNKAYFQQGFSAKGILHVKANLNRSKLEELRRHWNHMVKGNRNSFQTPIMSGMEEIQWIPLTQNHSEMEFSMWLNYLIKMICAVYQIDPSEIGYGMRDSGGGGGLSGDNTQEKLKQSKDKGFLPLMNFLASYINNNIIDKIDDDFCLEWVGLEEEDLAQKVQIELQEIKYKRTVNEIREADGLPPIKGADDLILDPTFFQWFSQFHPDGQKMQQSQQQTEMMQQQPDPMEQDNKQQDAQIAEQGKQADHQRAMEMEQMKGLMAPSEPTKKSIKIEYYTLKK